MDPIFEIGIHLPPARSRRRLHALHAQLRAAILDGRLKPGLRLPATRTFAQVLGVARNTVIAAYDLLLSEGYVVARAGAGNYVAKLLPAMPTPPAAPRLGTDDPRLSRAARRLGVAPRVPSPRPRFDFAVGIPDTRALRTDLWHRLAARRLRLLSRRQLDYGAPEGQRRLRAAIAAHVSFARAVACSAESIVITAGAQQAFDLLARVLVTPGRSVVAVEHPGYGPARAAFAAAGAKIVAVPVDGEGLVVERLPSEARVIYVTPAHQFPLGCVLSARRRLALLEFARKHRAVIIEDDYDGEFRFSGRPLDALQTLDRAHSVFFVGTFSKSLFPGLRIGFVAAPPWALPALTAAKHRADLHCDLIAQETLAAFITEGHLLRHVRRMRRLYAGRRQRLLAVLQRDFSRWLEPVPGVAGLHLTTIAAGKLDVRRLAEQARELDVGVYPLPGFPMVCAPARPRGLLFGYGCIDEADIDEGLRRLRWLLGSRQEDLRAPSTDVGAAASRRRPRGRRIVPG